jgi:ProP effector
MSKPNFKGTLHLKTQKPLTLKKEVVVKARENFKEVKKWLEATYPKAFDFQNPIPLKKGIRQEIMAKDFPFSKVQLRNGLNAYARSNPYLKAIIQHQWRHDLNGKQTEEILEEEKKYSKQLLLLRKEKKYAKKTKTSSGDKRVKKNKDYGSEKNLAKNQCHG